MCRERGVVCRERGVVYRERCSVQGQWLTSELPGMPGRVESWRPV